MFLSASVTLPLNFNPRPPRGGRRLRPLFCVIWKNFNPRPPRGGRPCQLQCTPCGPMYFNPRPPRGGRLRHPTKMRRKAYFNPRPPRGGRRPFCNAPDALSRISIHAPREGGDFTRSVSITHKISISIHAPREGGDYRAAGQCLFHEHFNPRPPRGGRHGIIYDSWNSENISIHAPREGGDIDAAV